MAGFTKLVPEIVQSSIWNESSDTRVVWITMLALKDENGFVRGSSKTLSRMANVSLDKVEEALEKFLSPDPDSCTPDDDGRRIQEYTGGWLVLNHIKYRDKEHILREQNRERVRRFRERNKEKPSVTECNVTSALPSVSASVSESASVPNASEKNKQPKVSKGEIIDKQFDEFWKSYPKKVKGEDAKKAYKQVFKELPENLLEILAQHKKLDQWNRDKGKYIPYAASWLRGRRWNDELEGVAPKQATNNDSDYVRKVLGL